MALIEAVLKAGPERADVLISAAGLTPLAQWHAFFFPAEQHNLYLFLEPATGADHLLVALVRYLECRQPAWAGMLSSS